jgi:erythritol transport system ATP-binding protein
MNGTTMNQTGAGGAPPSPVLLRAEGIRKVYPGTVALKNVDFNVYRGKVNVLVGENGAGKSTLMKILAGVERPSEGRILLEGREVKLESTSDALAKGIGIIYQELNLFPNLSVAENVFANREKMKFAGWIDHAAQNEAAAALMARLRQDIDPKTLVKDLKVGQQQLVEIAKALSEEASLLIMDEPTSALSGAEVEVLFEIIEELKANGVTIIYISHRLEELIQIGDFITVLRDGNLITEKPMAEVDLPWIVHSMVGTDTNFIFHGERHELGETILEVQDLSLPSPSGRMSLDGISFTLKAGEILGLYGLLGAGRTEILETIMGMHEESSGKVYLNGELLGEPVISQRIRKGISLVPEDRQREGLVQTMSIGHNMSLAGLWRIVSARFHIKKKNEKGCIDEMVRKMSIKTAGADRLISSLSGGNQQKVVIGKSLLTNPKVLMLDEPTRGIDVGAKGEVFRIMNVLSQDGIGLIFVTAEIKELRAVCDRILVLSKGRIVGEFSRENATQEALVAASAEGHVTTSSKNKGSANNHG